MLNIKGFRLLYLFIFLVIFLNSTVCSGQNRKYQKILDTERVGDIVLDKGIIFSYNSAQTLEGFCKKPRTCYSPKKDEVLRLEQDLSSFFNDKSKWLGKKFKDNLTDEVDERRIIYSAEIIANELGSYKRKYYGYIRNDEKWIMVNAVCSQFWNERSLSSSVWKPENDMGRCFFQLHYQLKSRDFYDFYVDIEV